MMAVSMDVNSAASKVEYSAMTTAATKVLLKVASKVALKVEN